MNPYRETPEVPEKDKHLAELAMFGIRMDTGRPILERVKTNRCSMCSGFGTYGNPLCGAVYTCKRCKGSGYDPIPEEVRRTYSYRICKLLKHEEEGTNSG